MHIEGFLLIVLVFIIWMQYKLYITNKKSKNISKEFWKIEHKANLARKQDISSLNYIEFSSDDLLSSLDYDNESKYYYNNLLSLAYQKIAKLSSLSNTELKLKYGVGNFKHLCECDSNYLCLITNIYKLSNSLYHKNRYIEAKFYLENAIFKYKCDIPDAFLLLANIYKALGMYNQITILKYYLTNISKASKQNKLKHDINQIYNGP